MHKNRFIIDRIKVDAPLSFKKIGENGNMPLPNSPDEVVYYDFSNFPNFGGKIGEHGNAVLSGHVDSGFDYCDYGKTPPPCKAVLWSLDKLEKGDEIKIVIGEGTFSYKVITNKQIKSSGVVWGKVFKSTKKEIITIFTCAGEFDFDKIEYKARQVVRAVRLRIAAKNEKTINDKFKS